MSFISRNLVSLLVVFVLIVTSRCDSCIKDIKNEEKFRSSLDKLLNDVYASVLLISLHNVLLLCCRETTRGVHENGDEYDYKIGICTPPSREIPGCAVVQEKRIGSDVHRVCLGKLNATTVIDSELCYS